MERKCLYCRFCQWPRTSDDNGGNCKCGAMKRKTIDVYVSGGETPAWCPYERRVEEIANELIKTFQYVLSKQTCTIIAEDLIKLDYRKAAEVAKEIFAELDRLMLDGEIGGKYPAKVINPDKYSELKKKYTEEREAAK